MALPAVAGRLDGASWPSYPLKEPAVVQLSISGQPVGGKWAKPPLDQCLKDSEREPMLHGDFNLCGRLTPFRRAPRELPACEDGFEFLTKTPERGVRKASHDVRMIVPGTADSLLHRHADIRLSSGITGNASGSADPLWTDEEVIALRDALPGTIRVRPVTAKAAAALPDVPIGTLAASGRDCPRTGLWRCADEGPPVHGGREPWFRADETMPAAELFGEPSRLRRLRGETPSHASPTVWRLARAEAADGDRGAP